MAIRKFNAPEESEPTPEVPAPKSKFDPFNPKRDERKSVLGEKVYTEGEKRMSREEAEAFVTDLMRRAEDYYKTTEGVILAYSKTMQSPSDKNIREYSDAVDKIANDPQTARGVLSILIAVVSANYKRGR